MTVTQDAPTARYIDDGGAQYEETVCGNVFTFLNDDPSETEMGMMTLTGEGTAVKTPMFGETSAPFCSGDCEDTLIRN